MKRFFIALILGILFFSCQNKETFIVGTWKIEGVGTADTTSETGKMLAYALLTMQSEGAEWEFKKDGSFTIAYKNNSPSSSGRYSLTDEKSLVLKLDNKEEKYELNKSSATQIQIKSTQTATVINLIKK